MVAFNRFEIVGLCLKAVRNGLKRADLVSIIYLRSGWILSGWYGVYALTTHYIPIGYLESIDKFEIIIQEFEFVRRSPEGFWGSFRQSRRTPGWFCASLTDSDLCSMLGNMTGGLWWSVK
jgi:hypothetical protein